MGARQDAAAEAGDLMTVELPYGIDDKEWLEHEDLDTGTEAIDALKDTEWVLR